MGPGSFRAEARQPTCFNRGKEGRKRNEFPSPTLGQLRLQEKIEPSWRWVTEKKKIGRGAVGKFRGVEGKGRRKGGLSSAILVFLGEA